MALTWVQTLFNAGWNFMGCSYPIWNGFTFKRLFMILLYIPIGFFILSKIVGGVGSFFDVQDRKTERIKADIDKYKPVRTFSYSYKYGPGTVHVRQRLD